MNMNVWNKFNFLKKTFIFSDCFWLSRTNTFGIMVDGCSVITGYNSVWRKRVVNLFVPSVKKKIKNKKRLRARHFYFTWRAQRFIPAGTALTSFAAAGRVSTHAHTAILGSLWITRGSSFMHSPPDFLPARRRPRRLSSPVALNDQLPRLLHRTTLGHRR